MLPLSCASAGNAHATRNRTVRRRERWSLDMWGRWGTGSPKLGADSDRVKGFVRVVQEFCKVSRGESVERRASGAGPRLRAHAPAVTRAKASPSQPFAPTVWIAVVET